VRALVVLCITLHSLVHALDLPPTALDSGSDSHWPSNSSSWEGGCVGAWVGASLCTLTLIHTHCPTLRLLHGCHLHEVFWSGSPLALQPCDVFYHVALNHIHALHLPHSARCMAVICRLCSGSHSALRASQVFQSITRLTMLPWTPFSTGGLLVRPHSAASRIRCRILHSVSHVLTLVMALNF
jgi:hypothetical protein